MAPGISRVIFATIFENIFGIIRRMYKRVMNYPVYISLIKYRNSTGVVQNSECLSLLYRSTNTRLKARLSLRPNLDYV